MENIFSYIITADNCYESYQEITVQVHGEIDMQEVKKVHYIRMFDKYHDWFRPQESEIEFQEEPSIRSEMKFIEYDMKGGEVCTVVFSKLVNHDHMDEHISRIIFKSKLGSGSVARAGFYSAGNKYGKSESLRIDSTGKKF